MFRHHHAIIMDDVRQIVFKTIFLYRYIVFTSVDKIIYSQNSSLNIAYSIHAVLCL